MLPPPTTATIATVVMTITVVIGAGISLFAHRAADRHDSTPLRLFGFGFAAITLGVLGGGVAAVGLGWGAVETLFVQGTLVAVGFALLARSLFAATSGAGPPVGDPR